MRLERLLLPYMERYYQQYGQTEDDIAAYLRTCLAEDGHADPATLAEATDKGLEFFFRCYYQRVRSRTNRRLRKAVRQGRAKVRVVEGVSQLVVEEWMSTFLPLPDGVIPRGQAHEEDFRRAVALTRRQVASMIGNSAYDEAAANQLANAREATGEDLTFKEADRRGLIDWRALVAA